ncbi:MAG TPA: alpha-L-rhamnosidase N-terminal domain-containing protein, partial [Segetibacter sp.]
MKKNAYLFILSQLAIFSLLAQVTVTNLLLENKSNPSGVDVLQPRFSWQLSSNQRNVAQSAYEVKVTSTGNHLTWNSGKVPSAQSVHVPYSGSPLQSGQKYFWQVRVWDNMGKASRWSEPANWQTGLLQSSDWKAKWIAVGYNEDSVLRPSPLFRKKFSAGKKVQSATAYITSHGIYEAFINGKRVGDCYLTPGWTSYNKRLQYQMYDVTPLLQSGDNAVGVTLGSGWYRS